MSMLLGRHEALTFAIEAFVLAQAFTAQKHMCGAYADVETCLVPCGHRIQEVQSALNHENGKTNDEVLLAVMLSANPESTAQFRRTDSASGTWLPHTCGVHASLSCITAHLSARLVTAVMIAIGDHAVSIEPTGSSISC